MSWRNWVLFGIWAASGFLLVLNVLAWDVQMMLAWFAIGSTAILGVRYD